MWFSFLVIEICDYIASLITNQAYTITLPSPFINATLKPQIRADELFVELLNPSLN